VESGQRSCSYCRGNPSWHCVGVSLERDGEGAEVSAEELSRMTIEQGWGWIVSKLAMAIAMAMVMVMPTAAHGCVIDGVGPE
jgi:hypothetical protein